MPVPAPTPDTRWRCTLCGNLTRFDVLRSTRAHEYVHVSLAGEPVVEEREVLAATVEHVTCRWCGRVDSVELVPRPGNVAEPRPVGSLRSPAGSPGALGLLGTPAGSAGDPGSPRSPAQP